MPSESDFEPRSPRYGPFLVLGCWCTLRSFWGFLAPFWAVFRTYRGVRGHQRSLGHKKVRPHVKCSSRLPSFGCFEPLLGLLWAKNGCFWPKTAQVWEAPPDLAPTPRAATGEFLAQNLDTYIVTIVTIVTNIPIKTVMGTSPSSELCRRFCHTTHRPVLLQRMYNHVQNPVVVEGDHFFEGLNGKSKVLHRNRAPNLPPTHPNLIHPSGGGS